MHPYRLINVSKDGAIVRAVIDNPPVNLVSLEMVAEFSQLIDWLAASPDVSVFILRSANPDFFLAHFDVEAILARPIDGAPERHAPETNPAHALGLRFRALEMITITEITGRIGGGGAEFAMAFDMRFGSIEGTLLNQMEVPLGIVPGGGGTQRLPRLVGTARALEILAGGDDIDAETLAAWGWLNRALPHQELARHVDRLAARIASFSPDAVKTVKRLVTHSEADILSGLAEESFEMQRRLRAAEARETMARFLIGGGQTRAGEAEIAELVYRLAGRRR